MTRPSTLDALEASSREIDSADCQLVSLYVDADGDGLGSDETAQVEVCSYPPPTGYAVANGDCDDSDPSLTYWVYPDQDGDHFGANEGQQCAGETTPGDSCGGSPAVRGDGRVQQRRCCRVRSG